MTLKELLEKTPNYPSKSNDAWDIWKGLITAHAKKRGLKYDGGSPFIWLMFNEDPTHEDMPLLLAQFALLYG